MKLKNFNFMFFTVLICIAMSLFYGAWSFKIAKNTIIENQDYEHISQEQERQFNEWDLDGLFRYNFYFGLFFFFLIFVYLFQCIERRSSNETRR